MHICIAARTTELCDRLRTYVANIDDRAGIETWNEPEALMHRSDYSDWDIVIAETCGDNSDSVIRLAQRISDISPQTGFIIVAQDESHAGDAMNTHFQAYLVEPVTEEQLRSEICYYNKKRSALQPENESGSENVPLLTIREDNGFDCLIDGVPVRFRHNKTRDAIEYLVTRNGAMVEDRELIEALWGHETTSIKSYLRSVKAEIVNLFNEAGCGDAIVKHRGRMGILMNRLT